MYCHRLALYEPKETFDWDKSGLCNHIVREAKGHDLNGSPNVVSSEEFRKRHFYP